MGFERSPHQSRRLPKETGRSRLANNPTEAAPIVERTLGGLRIDLPGAFSIPVDASRFEVRQRNFVPGGLGMSLTPKEKRKGKKPQR